MPKQGNTWRIYVKRCYYKKLAILIVIVLTVTLLALFKGALIDILLLVKIRREEVGMDSTFCEAKNSLESCLK